MKAVLYIRNSTSDAEVVFELLTPETAKLIECEMEVDWDAKDNPLVSFSKFMHMHNYILSNKVEILYELNQIIEE
jgi:hypothetical protein